jgi:hypothetical protein
MAEVKGNTSRATSEEEFSGSLRRGLLTQRRREDKAKRDFADYHLFVAVKGLPNSASASLRLLRLCVKMDCTASLKRGQPAGNRRFIYF